VEVWVGHVIAGEEGSIAQEVREGLQLAVQALEVPFLQILLKQDKTNNCTVGLKILLLI
jgi:hypothetical protein